MVLRLNGGGETSPLGGVDSPRVTLPVVPPAPGVVVAVVVVAPGDTSGEITPPIAYSDRFNP